MIYLIVTFERDGAQHDVTITPRASDDHRRWLLGIVQQRTVETMSIPGATVAGLAFPIHELADRVAMMRDPDAGGPAGAADMFRAAKSTSFDFAYTVLLRLSVNVLALMLIVDGARSFVAWRNLRRTGSRS